ncbi:hypothetical protein PIB30_025165 [Stylosanthes scabra]|uniref:Uncharacterized protein n=1 Tax=Stylosanthes scabra TaxID=79078 RepID=A0ABU6YBX5_9FABA|nr:hypothetical protein [Stylosanthes scabra]
MAAASQHDLYGIPSWNQVEASTQLGELYMTTHAGDRPAKQRRQDRNVITTVLAFPATMTSGVARLSLISTFRRRRRPEATPEMALNLAECKLAAYIFGHFDRTGEILFKNGILNMTRSAFYSICPGEQLNTDVVRAMLLIATDAERKRETVKAWFLPCSFATQVWAGAPLSELDLAYEKLYMPAMKTLRHLFLPVAEADGSYYLVLIDLKDRAVYSMDVCRTAETIAQREVVIEKLRNAVGTILLLERHNKGFTSRWIPDPANFRDVRYPEGLSDDLRMLVSPQ